MPRYKLTVAYDGTNFHGWQKQQPPGSDPLRTVQGVLEEAVIEAVREKVNLLGASRTDAGVHAMGQVAAFSSAVEIDPARLVEAVTSRLPADVQVHEACLVPPAFDPIQDCLSKGYRYRLASARRRSSTRPLFDRHYTAWSPWELDVEAMDRAAQHLVGEHDFASLTRLNHGRESTIRTIHECTVRAEGDQRICIDVAGNGFLYNMVRIIAGTLVEVGRGRISDDVIPDLLESCDRSRTGRTMPPEGLCLMWIDYGG